MTPPVSRGRGSPVNNTGKVRRPATPEAISVMAAAELQFAAGTLHPKDTL
jgi:hypothetical protein